MGRRPTKIFKHENFTTHHFVRYYHYVIGFRTAYAGATVGGEVRTERVTAMEEFSKGVFVFGATTYIKKYGRRRLERRLCAKERPKTLPIDTLTVVGESNGLQCCALCFAPYHVLIILCRKKFVVGNIW